MLELFRVLYAVLAVVCSTGFVATLVIRWEELARGERILRFGLIVEQMTLVYGAYYALAHSLPGSIAAPLLVVSMSVMTLGFLDWILHDLLPKYRAG